MSNRLHSPLKWQCTVPLKSRWYDDQFRSERGEGVAGDRAGDERGDRGIDPRTRETVENYVRALDVLPLRSDEMDPRSGDVERFFDLFYTLEPQA